MNCARSGAWIGLWTLLAAAPVVAGPPGPAPALGELTGDVIAIDSDWQRTEGDWIQAGGTLVDIRYRDLVLQAQYVEINQVTHDAIAEGDVVFQQGPQRLTGDRLELNLESGLGKLWKVWGYDNPDVFFTAREVTKVDRARYNLRGATVTSCNQPRPQWRLKASHGVYEEDRYMRLWNARLEVLGVPVVYLPVFQYPVRRERSTGFLFPSIGSNNVRGFTIGNAFFWAIGRSYDATITHDWYAEGSQLVGAEFRYVPSENANGLITGERLIDDVNGSASGFQMTHSQRIGDTIRLGASIDYSSRETIDRLYSNNVNDITRRFRNSRAYVERHWSRYSLGVAANHSVAFSGADLQSTQQVMPQASFAVRDTQLLGPLFVSLNSLAARLGTRPTRTSATEFWERVDVLPEVRMPWTPVPWLELLPEASYRLTWYSDTLPPVATGTAGAAVTAATQSRLSGGDYLRKIGRYQVRLAGPTVQRIFERPDSEYSTKLKHVIQPEVRYQYQTKDDDAARTPFFDGTDGLGGIAVSRMDFLLRNRVLAKRSAVPGAVATPHELLLVEFGSSYDFEALPGSDSLLPATGLVRFVPTLDLAVTYQFTLDVNDWFLSNQTLQGTWNVERYYLDMTYARRRNATTVFDEQLRSALRLQAFGGRIHVSGGLDYDLHLNEVRDLLGQAVYRTQCCGFGVGYRLFRFGLRDDNELSFSVTLKNVGTVFDYTFGNNRL